MGGSGVPPVYLAGTVLLETYVRYGSISFNREDIFQEEGGWRPTAKQVSDLMSGFKSIPLAKVTFVSIGNGGVSYSVVKVTTDDWWERGLSTSGRFRPCFSWLKGTIRSVLWRASLAWLSYSGICGVARISLGAVNCLPYTKRFRKISVADPGEGPGGPGPLYF